MCWLVWQIGKEYAMENDDRLVVGTILALFVMGCLCLASAGLLSVGWPYAATVCLTLMVLTWYC